MGMSGLIDAVISWPTFALILVVFGFAPGALLRLIVLAFPRDDPRRQELRAELYAVPRIERPFWVAEQLEVALFEGLWNRLARAITRRMINRMRRALIVGGRWHARVPGPILGSLLYCIPRGVRERLWAAALDGVHLENYVDISAAIRGWRGVRRSRQIDAGLRPARR
jgi:hypothetical protein